MKHKSRSCLAGVTLLAAIWAAGCGSQQQNNPAAPTPIPPSATFTIDIAEMNGPNSFYPSPANVATGQTVIWRNDDRVTHHVVFDTLAVDAGTTAPGTSSQPNTIAAGTWSYHCAIHPSMVGTVTVIGSDQPAPAQY